VRRKRSLWGASAVAEPNREGGKRFDEVSRGGGSEEARGREGQFTSSP